MSSKKSSRRDFIRLAAASAAAAGWAPAAVESRRVQMLEAHSRPTVAPSDTLGIATIGMGIIGMIDTDTALEVPGVRLVAAADCYDGRLARTKEYYGNDVATTRDYREILQRSDVDAVLICTPDHWHARMAIEAMEAGKAVYCEKPMVHDLDEGPAMIEAQRRTGQPLIVGSQHSSSILYAKAQELFRSGAIGELNMVEASTNRNSAIGAWQYSVAPDASPETIDWDMFQGDAPKHPFDPKRFFWWRGYRDYGTGVAGDLFVHLFTGIHYTVGAIGPTSVVAMGGLRFWKDGRDMPDVTLGLFDYPETEHHPAFTLSLQSNFADGSGGGQLFRFIGSEGVMEAGWNRLTLRSVPRRRASEQSVIEGYNSVRTFDEAQRQVFRDEYRAKYPLPEPGATSQESTFEVPSGYDSRLDHFLNFFAGIRDGTPIEHDPTFGFRAAAPSLLCNSSLFSETIHRWDPDLMRLIE